jgi:hypothetical protein
MNIEISPKEYERRLNWHDAILYCQLLIIDNKNDWRLPTKDELDDIYHSENDFYDTYYWSSTEINGIFVWGQNMKDGHQNDNFKNGRYYVRPVRSLTI